MKPTLQFRWLAKNVVEETLPDDRQIGRLTTVLQQFWDSGVALRSTGEAVPGEWRDVPICYNDALGL